MIFVTIFGMVIVLKENNKKKLHIGMSVDIDMTHFPAKKNVGKIILNII